MTILSSIKSWLIRHLKEDLPMSDATNEYPGPLPATDADVAHALTQALAPAGNALAGELATVAETALVAAVPAPLAPIVAAAINTDVLKGVLLALGHDLGPVWDDAVALAKKAL